MFQRIGFAFSFFEREQNAAAEAQGVVEGFQAGGELFPLVVAEIAGVAAEGQHEVIKVERTLLEQHFFMGEVEPGDLVEQHGDIRPVGQDAADGLGDVGGGQGTGGDLVKQRLEQMMVGAVNEGDADIGMMKLFAERQAAEACAEHDNMWLFASFHADNVMQTVQKANVKTHEEIIDGNTPILA